MSVQHHAKFQSNRYEPILIYPVAILHESIDSHFSNSKEKTYTDYEPSVVDATAVIKREANMINLILKLVYV